MQQPISRFHSISLFNCRNTYPIYILSCQLERWLLCTKTSMYTSLLQLGDSDAHEMDFKSCTVLQNNPGLSWIQATDFTVISSRHTEAKFDVSNLILTKPGGLHDSLIFPLHLTASQCRLMRFVDFVNFLATTIGSTECSSNTIFLWKLN